jgi:hypothetical protein
MIATWVFATKKEKRLEGTFGVFPKTFRKSANAVAWFFFYGFLV